MFNLSTVAIKNIKGIENKKDYIYSTMSKKIDELVGAFDKKTETREINFKNSDKEFEKSKNKL